MINTPNSPYLSDNHIENAFYYLQYLSRLDGSFVGDISQNKTSVSRTISEYSYNAEGKRFKKVVGGVTTYHIGKDYETQVEGETTENTVYYYANNELVGKKNTTGTYHYHNDHLGGTHVVTDSNGNVVERTRYYPFGKILTGGDSRNLFTGQEYDTDTGLYYYGARYYNPAIRRFTQPDTIIPDYYNPQALNRYSYTLNNPIKYTDPDGHQTGILIKALPVIVYAVKQEVTDLGYYAISQGQTLVKVLRIRFEDGRMPYRDECKTIEAGYRDAAKTASTVAEGDPLSLWTPNLFTEYGPNICDYCTFVPMLNLDNQQQTDSNPQPAALDTHKEGTDSKQDNGEANQQQSAAYLEPTFEDFTNAVNPQSDENRQSIFTCNSDKR